MKKTTQRWLLALLGVLLGVGFAGELLDFLVKIQLISPNHANLYPWISLTAYILSAGIFAVLFYFLAIPCAAAVGRQIKRFERWLSRLPMIDTLFGGAGLLLGTLMSFLVTSMLMRGRDSWLLTIISAVIYLILGYLGATICFRRWRELNFAWVKKLQQQTDLDTPARGGCPKVLDTSVIIDGRIFDLCRTGFVEGTLIVPAFVLRELQHISDSADPLKRNRGRRGLDVLARIRKELEMRVTVDEQDFDDTDEVDVKLLKLARLRGGCVMTNDYNLNKVAGVSGIKVLNINDLANALKPVLLPGEEMNVQIVKEGKEQNQGVAYLDDGTMIVVENGKKAIGEQVTVLVTSVLQTSAGRMIFARLKPEE